MVGWCYAHGRTRGAWCSSGSDGNRRPPSGLRPGAAERGEDALDVTDGRGGARPDAGYERRQFMVPIPSDQQARLDALPGDLRELAREDPAALLAPVSAPLSGASSGVPVSTASRDAPVSWATSRPGTSGAPAPLSRTWMREGAEQPRSAMASVTGTTRTLRGYATTADECQRVPRATRGAATRGRSSARCGPG